MTAGPCNSIELLTARRLAAAGFAFTARARTSDCIDSAIEWCLVEFGHRWVRWTYRGANRFAFLQQDDAVLFVLTWG